MEAKTNDNSEATSSRKPDQECERSEKKKELARDQRNVGHRKSSLVKQVDQFILLGTESINARQFFTHVYRLYHFCVFNLQVETHLVYCSLGCWKPCRHDCYDCDIIRTSRLVFPYRSLWSWIPGSLKHHFQREKLSILERVLQIYIYIPTYPTYIWNTYGVIFGEQLLFRVPSHFGTPKFSQKWAFLSAKVSISIMKTLLLNLGPMGRKSPKFHPFVISKKPLVLFRVPDYETYASSFVHDSSERVEILGKTN